MEGIKCHAHAEKHTGIGFSRIFCIPKWKTTENFLILTHMTPRDDGDSGQAKNRKIGKCRDMLVFQDMMKYNVMYEN
jgi:hypothetical protein